MEDQFPQLREKEIDRPETITVDMKRLEIDELTRRVDCMSDAIKKIILAINTGRKIKIIED